MSDQFIVVDDGSNIGILNTNGMRYSYQNFRDSADGNCMLLNGDPSLQSLFPWFDVPEVTKAFLDKVKTIAIQTKRQSLRQKLENQLESCHMLYSSLVSDIVKDAAARKAIEDCLDSARAYTLAYVEFPQEACE